ncbi:hypothetical protein ACFLVU_04395 [Chloroflexota bacterium]
MDEVKLIEQYILKVVGLAEQRAKDRASAARWDLDIAVFAHAVLAVVIILSSQEIRVEIVAIAAAAGLAMVWLAGWDRGRKLYGRFYDEEMVKLRQELKVDIMMVDGETVDDAVRKALLERKW